VADRARPAARLTIAAVVIPRGDARRAREVDHGGMTATDESAASPPKAVAADRCDAAEPPSADDGLDHRRQQRSHREQVARAAIEQRVDGAVGHEAADRGLVERGDEATAERAVGADVGPDVRERAARGKQDAGQHGEEHRCGRSSGPRAHRTASPAPGRGHDHLQASARAHGPIFMPRRSAVVTPCG
jgi:hypothetical protein